MLFDTHAHYDDDRFNPDRENVIESLGNSGVSLVVNIGCDLTTSVKSVQLAEKYPFFYAAVGFHPHNAKDMKDQDLMMLEAMTKRKKVVAIGEIGLDYHYDNSPRDIQRKRFSQQMELAADLNMPVVIHEREAHNDCMEIVRKYAGKISRGVFHCYSGALEQAKELIRLGWYLSFTGVVTYKNARKSLEVIEWMPLDRLMIETDCPYLSPEPNRGKRNDSRNLRYTAEKIAEARNLSYEELTGITMENGRRFFDIDQ